MVFSDVVGEDLRRFDWRDGGVGLAERVCFRGVELEDELGKWDLRCGIADNTIRTFNKASAAT